MSGDKGGGGFLGPPPAPPTVRLADGKDVSLPADMSNRIIDERMAPTSTAGDYRRNLAVVRIEIKDKKSGAVTYENVSAWNLEKQHSEPLALEKVEKRRKQLGRNVTVTVTHLYTERIPCSHGRADCKWVIKQKNIPHSNVYYSVEVPDGTLAKKLESHYEPYVRNRVPRTPPPEPFPGSKKKPPKGGGGGKLAKVAVIAGLGGAPQAAEAAKPRIVDTSAATSRATAPDQRMTDRPDPQGRGVWSKGTADKGATRPAPTVAEPKILTSPPAQPSAPASPSASTANHPPPVSNAPKAGTKAKERVVVSYDFTGGAKRDAVKMKSVDVTDFFRQESRITRAIKSEPMKKLAKASAPTAASLLTGWGINKIKQHFAGLIAEFKGNFDAAFPPADVVAADYELEELKETFDGIIAEPSGWWQKMTTKEVVMFIDAIFLYEKVNLQVQERLVDDLHGDLPRVYQDIAARQDVLSRIYHNLEDVFTEIHSQVYGAIPIVYYASFDIWMVKEVFEDLAGLMSSLQSHVYQRQAQYAKFQDQLAKELDKAAPHLNAWRDYYHQHLHLLK